MEDSYKSILQELLQTVLNCNNNCKNPAEYRKENSDWKFCKECMEEDVTDPDSDYDQDKFWHPLSYRDLILRSQKLVRNRE